jgi:DNA mismatch endonuclease Vsr
LWSPSAFLIVPSRLEFASGTDAGASRTRNSACALFRAYEPARACKRERGLQGRFSREFTQAGIGSAVHDTLADLASDKTPDLSFPFYSSVLFVHGCFWHGHDCRQGRVPTSNTEYWGPKVAANQLRDTRKEEELRALGWRVFRIWGCELRSSKERDDLFDRIAMEIRATD